MKLFMKLFNIVFIGTVFVLLLGLITSTEYQDVILIAPLFFKDFVILVAYTISVYAIHSVILQPEDVKISNFIVFLSISVLSFQLAYLSHPEVKMQILFERTVEYSFNEEEYNEAKEKYKNNDALDYFYLIDKERRLFRDLYELQYNYLKEYNNQRNSYTYPQFLFFVILGIVLLGNGLFKFFKSDQ